MAARSEALACGLSPAAIAILNTARGHGCFYPVSIVFCQVEVFVFG